MKLHVLSEDRRSYREAVQTARKMQGDLINLVDELLLDNWNDAGLCSDAALEIMTHLLERYPNLETEASSVVNLLDVINKVCALAEYTYRLRTDCIARPSLVDEDS